MREGAGIAMAITGMVAVFFVFLPFALVVALYVFISVYGMTKAFDPTGVNVAVFLTGFALITAAMVVLLMAGVALIGKALGPRRSRDRLRRPPEDL